MEVALFNTKGDSREKKQPDLSDPVYEKKIIFWDGLSIVLKMTGLIVWFCIFVLAILEIKRYTNWDVIPGYDSALDDMYGAIRGGITNAVNRGR